jgi:type VI secretion system lysozyme-like protein
MKLRLLKRIRNWEQAEVVSASDADVDEVMESMRDDLEKLFNTRRGTVLTDEEYGLPDFSQLMNGYAAPDVEEIERDLLQQLRQYEMRLSTIAFEYQQGKRSTTSLNFGLSAMLQHKQQDINFRASVQFADNGTIRVSL